MKIILGLGNPGSRYEMTRHNIGWLVLDAVAERLRTEFEPGKGDYYQAQGSWRGKKVLLVKPTTYMNNSGQAATQVLRHFRTTQQQMLVVVDEVQIPLGKIKITSSGSSGGHNGLESILYHLASDTFARLRCGVGNNFGPGELVEYVLSTFSSEEKTLLEATIDQGKEAVLLWIAEGTSQAMNRVNTRTKKSNDNPAVQSQSGTSSEDGREE